MYIHQLVEWPAFIWDEIKINNQLLEARYLQGRLLGHMEALGFNLREEASLQILTQDVVKTSEIEGETLDWQQVRSSLARKLGINITNSLPTNRHVEGIVEIILDATRNYNTPLTQQRLWAWHTTLFPIEQNNINRMVVGQWRTEASGIMQVVSGPYGREKIHFEAPSHDRLDKEMQNFIHWFNSPSTIDPVIQAAIAHFWFVTIHPFDDGNGRIARAIADMLLARAEKTSQRFYSMSTQIQQERKSYYDILEQSQKSTLDITPWLEWFLNCFTSALNNSQKMLEIVLNKARFWETYKNESLNDRQRKVINRLLDGFVGKLTSSKWAKLNKCSQDTALRDITDLLNREIFIKDPAGGRSTNYQLPLAFQHHNTDDSSIGQRG